MNAHERGRGEQVSTYTEEVEVSGNLLVEWVGHLLKDNGIREIRVKAPGGQIVIDPSAAVSGGAGLETMWLAILGALAATVPRLPIEIVRMGVTPEDEISRLWEEGGERTSA